MSILTIAIMGALLLAIAVMGAGVWSMVHGGEFDKKHSTSFMFARVGMQALAVLLVFLALYITSS